jgi:hypothetical protein
MTLVKKTDCFEAFGCRVSIKDQKILIFCKDFHNPDLVSVNIVKYLIWEGFASGATGYEIEVIKEKN